MLAPNQFYPIEQTWIFVDIKKLIDII